MELVVLGSGGGWATAGGTACGYLVRHDGFDLWVDAGTGTLANLQRHIGLLDLDAVVISHRHFDHFLDLYPYYLARVYRDDSPPPIPLFAPPGMFEHAARIEGSLADAYSSEPVQPGDTFEAGPFRIATAPMRHPVPTLGMRIEAGGRTLAYSADSGPNDELALLSKGADLLLCEATFDEAQSRRREPIHMNGREAGEVAARAGAAALVLTHIWPTNDREKTRRQAASVFGGPVTVAEEGLKLAL